MMNFYEGGGDNNVFFAFCLNGAFFEIFDFSCLCITHKSSYHYLRESIGIGNADLCVFFRVSFSLSLSLSLSSTTFSPTCAVYARV